MPDLLTKILHSVQDGDEAHFDNQMDLGTLIDGGFDGPRSIDDEILAPVPSQSCVAEERAGDDVGSYMAGGLGVRSTLVISTPSLALSPAQWYKGFSPGTLSILSPRAATGANKAERQATVKENFIVPESKGGGVAELVLWWGTLLRQWG